MDIPWYPPIIDRSQDTFESHCGWLSFDDEIEEAVERIHETYGRRTEIVCAREDRHEEVFIYLPSTLSPGCRRDL